MKVLMIVAGTILALLGLVSLVHPRFSYHRHEEIARVGPVHATFDRNEGTRVPPFASALLLASGVVLVVLGARSKS
jgi:hypothetical protein